MKSYKKEVLFYHTTLASSHHPSGDGAMTQCNGICHSHKHNHFLLSYYPTVGQICQDDVPQRYLEYPNALPTSYTYVLYEKILKVSFVSDTVSVNGTMCVKTFTYIQWFSYNVLIFYVSKGPISVFIILLCRMM